MYSKSKQQNNDFKYHRKIEFNLHDNNDCKCIYAIERIAYYCLVYGIQFHLIICNISIWTLHYCHYKSFKLKVYILNEVHDNRTT